MAAITRENIGTLHDKITVKVSKDDFMPSFEKSLKQYAKNASIPGFRKGMVPSGMLRKMYGPSIFNEEVIRVAGRQLEDYLKAEQLAIFAQPMILPTTDGTKLDMNNPADVDFSFEIGIKPEFDLATVIANANLNRYQIAVSDKMMADEVDRIKRRMGKVDEQTEVTANDNIIYSTYTICDADGNVADDASAIEDTEELSKVPAKMREMLMGKTPGFTTVIRPVDVCTEEELQGFLKDPLKAGAEAAEQYYMFNITKIGHLIPADLGVELYEKVFPGKTIENEEEFKNLVKEEISFQFARLSRERLQNEIFELLVHQTPIELPVNFLKRWLREGGEKVKSAEEVENEFSGFEHQLRWQLITDKVVAESGIQVTYDEVKNSIKAQVMGYFGMSADDEAEMPWLETYMGRIMKDEKTVDETFRRMMTDKIFTHLEGQFTTTPTDIEEEAFFKLADPHATHHHHH